MTVAGIIVLWPIFSSLAKELGTLLFGLSGIYIVGFAGLTALSLYMWKFWSNYRLEFTPTHIQLKILPHPFFRPFSMAYTDIVRVSRGLRGQLMLLPKQGKPVWVTAGVFEGGHNSVLSELSKHIDSNYIEPELEQALWVYRRPDKMFIWANIVIILSLLPYFYGLFGHSFVLRQIAWKDAYTGTIPERIENYWIDEDGSPWVLLHRSSNSQVIHLAGSEIQTWELPPENILLDETHSNNFLVSGSIISDARGIPWVAYAHTGLLRLNGDRWEWLAFRTDATNLSIRELKVANDAIWALVSHKDFGEELFKINPVNGEVSLVPLPSELHLQDIVIGSIKAQNDKLLVWLKGETSTYIYELNQGVWSNSFITVEGNTSFPDDFIVDSHQRLWVVETTFESGCPGNSEQVRVGLLDPMGNGWLWHAWPCHEDDIGYIRARSILVDSMDRVWVAVDDRLDVFRLTSESVLEPITHYSVLNSNYQDDYNRNPVRLGADGRIWSAGDHLAWLDTTAATLPSPVPAWLDFLGKRPLLPFLLFMYAWAVLAIIVFLYYYKHTQSEAEQKARLDAAAVVAGLLANKAA
jgi:streptogramin lyase